jgi:tripartite-type tricarboxylate transporter receptor subunit TctC
MFRWFLAGAVVAVSTLSPATTAHAQSAADFPSKPITLIVPFAAGVTADLLFRGYAEVAGKHLGQPVIVENKPGGSATLGPAQMAATAKPDGYTIAQVAIPVFRMPVMQKTTYDVLKDFTYIIHIGGYTLGAVVKGDSPFKTFKDVIDFSRANPGKFTYTTIGAATTNSIAMELIARQAGVQFTHVPGKGGGEGIAAVLGGHVMSMVESPSWAGAVASGDLRLLLILNGERSKKWPNVPTLKEAGFDYTFDSPFGLAGPKGMDEAVVKKLHDAFKLAYEDPKVIELHEKFDFVRRYMNTADYRAFVIKLAAEEKAALEKIGLAKKE